MARERWPIAGALGGEHEAALDRRLQRRAGGRRRFWRRHGHFAAGYFGISDWVRGRRGGAQADRLAQDMARRCGRVGLLVLSLWLRLRWVVGPGGSWLLGLPLLVWWSLLVLLLLLLL